MNTGNLKRHMLFGHMRFRRSVGVAFGASGLVIAGTLLGGCAGPSTASGGDVPPAATIKNPYTPKAEAGYEASFDTDTSGLKKLYVAAGSKYGSSRSDAFALTKSETQFETDQTGQMAFNNLNGFELDYVPNPPPDVLPTIEPQPYRRLAGVVVGDSVLAIIEMGDGSEKIVRPGEKIPDTEWTVVSIDQEKAVLHRDGNVLPHDVVVRLETPKPGTPGYNAGGAPTGNGFPGAGFPGGPPAGMGFPGGPGRGGPGAGRAGRGGGVGAG